MKTETNPRINKLRRRRKICDKTGKCDICPMHDGDNRRRSRRGNKKPKHKDKRK